MVTSNAPAPRYRAVVLGASNVTRGLRSIYQEAARRWGGPIDFVGAIGHGRSFGQTTTVLARRLPSILECELWDDWNQFDPLPTAGLITDIGNDIVYGHSAETIAGWVRECAQGMLPHCQRLVIAGLPLESLKALTQQQFDLLRSVLFPKSSLSYEHALRQAEELDDRLQQMTGELECLRCQPQKSWYAIDPIHIHRRHWRVAWSELLRPWNPDSEPSASQRRPNVPWLKVLLCPKHRWLFGYEQRCEQPAWRGRDGSQISLY